MKTILLTVMLGIGLGIAAFFWTKHREQRRVGSEKSAVMQPSPNLAKRSSGDESRMTEAKDRIFTASKQAIRENLRSPESAVFAGNLSDVQFERGEIETYKMSSFVHAQNASGVLLRMNWQTLFDRDERLVWMRIDDDESEPLEEVLRRLRGLPPREEGRGLAADEIENAGKSEVEHGHGETDARISELKDAKNREPLYAHAQEHLTAKLELLKHRNIKHSKLPQKDDKYIACYWLGNDVWEATGFVESIPPSATRPVKQAWKVSMVLSKEKKPEVLAYKLGEDEVGDLEISRARADVRPTISK